MDLQIKHHWNDAVVASSLKSRSVSPLPPISDDLLQSQVDELMAAPTKLTQPQHEAHVQKVRTHLRMADLSQDDRFDLNSALTKHTPELKRKAIVTFIREHDGVIRWAASLRALAESEIVTMS